MSTINLEQYLIDLLDDIELRTKLNRIISILQGSYNAVLEVAEGSAFSWQGFHDASTGSYPAAVDGGVWVVDTAGTISGTVYSVGDRFVSDGSTFEKLTLNGTTFLEVANDLSDLNSAANARANLALSFADNVAFAVATLSGVLRLNNNTALQMKNAAGSYQNVIRVDSADNINIRSAGNGYNWNSSGGSSQIAALSETGVLAINLSTGQLDLSTVNNVNRKSWTINITAGTTQTQAGATALTTDLNIVDSVGNTGDGVKLPDAATGMDVVIHNNGANSLQLWPATGDQIDGNATNAVDPNSLAAGSARRYITRNVARWLTT